MDLILNDFVWVIFIYSDESKRHIWTTLNPEIVRSQGLRLKENYVYDFKLGEFISFDNVQSVEITTEKSKFDREVDKYASRFI